MNLLIIGGTRFLGRHLVNAATAYGDTVTLFNRGKSNPHLFPELDQLIGDRDGDLEVLSGRKWDAVIDTCGYVPRIVRVSAEFLREAVGRYVYISSISVYSDEAKVGINEDDETGILADPDIEDINESSYGPLKAACEAEVQRVYGQRGLVIRPGLIVGAYDPTDRFTYWPWRVAQGGRMLVPESPEWLTQIIDVRDLADWILDIAHRGVGGIFNAVGPENPISFGTLLAACQKVSGSSPDKVWMDAEFLTNHNVKPWSDLPLWLPGEASAGMSHISNRKAVAAGLHFRSLEDTIGDTLAWAASRPDKYEFHAGLKLEREAELLREWQQHQAGAGAGAGA
ncbi:MAG: NAD-dependent epimerase/dehydratase family protein [Anaerolineales bacterium]